jgi:hypothetical protein
MRSYMYFHSWGYFDKCKQSPGAWTGGHEENCRFRSANCNHGPGQSEWFAVEAEYTASLRTKLLETHNVDIYATEGNWIPRPGMY